MPSTTLPSPALDTPPTPFAAVAAPRPAVPHNVPAALSSFVGRVREVAELGRALDGARLVTVIGPGGAGKTRLAREVAAARTAPDPAAHPDGVWWVELAPVGQAADVPAAIAAVLGVHPSPGRHLREALEEALRERRALLVLDNCEHVVDEVATLAESLLRAAPGLAVLATSREALAIEGEVAWPVPPLARPPVGEAAAGADGDGAIGAYEAVQLFVERAQASQPGFALTATNAAAVARICARLDGLPLALELAAATLPALGVEALAVRLDDALALLTRGRRTALPRHRTLRAVLDWSYALLGDDARALLRRLSVFRGPFTLEAAETVCAPAVDGDAGAAARAAAPAVVHALGRLVEHSLVEVQEQDGEARYRLLETVRQYGAVLLRGTPDAREVRARHARWAAALAADAEPDLFGPARGRTVERLKRDVDELRAALAWATGPDGEPMTAVRLAGALGWFWFSGVPWEEARALLAATLAAADAEGIADADRPLADRVALGTLFYPTIGLAYFAGEPDAMLTLAARELPLWDTVDADAAATPAQRLAAARGRALSEQLRGLAHAMRGEHALAVAPMDRALAVATASGDRWLAAVLTMRRALVHLMGGAHDAAEADYRAAAPALRAMGETWFLSLTHEGMAVNALLSGDLARAARQARLSVQVLAPEPDGWFISRGLDTLGVIVAASDAPDPDHARATRAARLFGAAAALRRRCGAAILGSDREPHARAVATLRARLGDAAFDAAHADGERVPLADVFALVADPALADGLAPDAARDVDEADARATAGTASADAGARAGTAAPPTPGTHAPGTHAPGDAVRRADGRDTATDGPGALRLDVLGPLAMARDGVSVGAESMPTGKVRELLLFLLLHDGATKDAVGLAFWPDASPAQVRNAFHVTLHHLRRHLGAPRWIGFAGNAYRLDRAPAPDVTLDADVDAVLAASARLRVAARRQERPDDATLDALGAALARARGDLAEGIATGDWIVAHQDRVRAAWVEGMDALARLLLAAGRARDAAATAHALVLREPLREGAHRLLMEALAAGGEPARALAHYETLAALLDREVGARPARETQALAERLRR